MARPNHIDLVSAPIGPVLTVMRVLDQDADFLRFLEQRRLMPGSEIVIEARDPAADLLQVKPSSGESIAVGLRAASKILVSPAGVAGAIASC